MCDDEGRGLGRVDFATVWRGGICQLQVVTFDLGSCTQTSHTPPAPLQRGVLIYYFLFDNKWFRVLVSPLERGLRGV